MKSKQKRYTKAELKRRGWNDKFIASLLPEPKEVHNSYNRSRPIKVWDADIVHTAEKNDELQQHIAAHQERTRKIAETKQRKLLEQLGDINTINPAADYPYARSIHRHFILHVGDTNTGKTYHALEALRDATPGVYLAPLRLLAMEIQDKFLEEDILCSMRTGEEEHLIDGASLMSSTVEKISLTTHYEVGVIDECQMLSDHARGGSWVRAILGLAADTIYLCMSPDAKDMCIKLIELCGDTYEVRTFQRKTPLEYIPQRLQLSDLQPHDAVILFSRKSVLQFAESVKSVGLRPSVIYGALPYQSRKAQIDMYNRGETNIIVSTDAIGMGMNLPIRRVIFAETNKFDGFCRRKLTPSEVKQISGRAGRQGMFDVGKVGVMKYNNFDPYDFCGDWSGYCIEQGLQEEVSPIKKAHIPFPETSIKDDIPLSTTLLNWNQVQYPDIFMQQDMYIVLTRAQKVERRHPQLTPHEVFKFASITFDEKNDNLNALWLMWIRQYLNGKEIVMPEPSDYDLITAEQSYKEHDLFYSFHRMLALPFDEEKLQEHKKQLIQRINELLLITNTKRAKCKKKKKKK
jgi:ATP-dependent RNA helicase SUPV3L1/SUV3